MPRTTPQRLRLTTATLDRLQADPPAERVTLYDLAAPGLAVRCTPTGTLTFVVYRRVRGQPRRLTLGTYPALGLPEARKRALAVLGKLASDEDPAPFARRRDRGATLGALFEEWVERRAPEKRTGAEDAHQWRRYVPEAWHRVPVAQLTRAHVLRWHEAIAKGRGPYAANRVLALLRAVVNKARTWDRYDGPNPFERVPKAPEQSRERRLDGNEMPAFFRALAAEPDRTRREALLCLVLTGQRRGAVLGMRAEELDFTRDLWTVPAARSKNKRPHVVPLVTEAAALLRQRAAEAEGPYLFPSPQSPERPLSTWAIEDAWRTARQAAGLADVRLHDLRRTLGSWQADTGAPLHIIGRTLGHHDPQVTAIYARPALGTVRAATQEAVAAILTAGGADARALTAGGPNAAE